jgi:AhpD family alkylhydroperoxidase
MEQRVNPYEIGKRAMQGLFSLGSYLSKSTIEHSLLDLINFRVSQINGCAYCLDMHAKDLRASGESEQRLYVLSAWREAPFYSDRERAALAWAEAVTNVNRNHVPDKVYEEAGKQFSEMELLDLTMAVITINCFNRINVAFRVEAGSYQPGEHAVLLNQN